MKTTMSHPQPKKIRETDENYLDFIREQPCLVCLDPIVEPHHTKTVGAGGSDYNAVPLCRRCHASAHYSGTHFFFKKKGIDPAFLKFIIERLRVKYEKKSRRRNNGKIL